MVIRRADEESEAGELPSRELLEAMGRYNEELINAGVMVGGEGLLPSSAGARVAFSGGKPTVLDGPFTEAKELIAGFSIIEVASKDEAIEWVKRWPALDGHGQARIELRRVYEIDDFGDRFTPELRAQEERHRGEAAAASKREA
ncbi:MAG TPA: YciI family protein [Mycobacteriales bacterium]|jgi:hypothetical protein|nr:YciI family protein [Mycobacteriales bacterium]